MGAAQGSCSDLHTFLGHCGEAPGRDALTSGLPESVQFLLSGCFAQGDVLPQNSRPLISAIHVSSVAPRD